MTKRTGGYTVGKAVVPSNTVDLPDGNCQALLVVATGNIQGDFPGGDADVVVGTAVAAGVIIEVALNRVRATGTTATVVALYRSLD